MNEAKTAQLIKDARKRREMTQKELAERIGVSVQAVSKWENAKGLPDISLLEPLSEALELPIAALVTGDEKGGDASEKIVRDVIDVSVKQTKKKLSSVKKLLAVLVFGVILGIIWWNVPKRFLKNVKPENVEKIVVFNGNNGHEFTISEAAEIEEFISSVSRVKMQKLKVSLGFGYAFRIRVVIRSELLPRSYSFMINSDSLIRKDPFFWYDISESLPFKWLQEKDAAIGAPKGPSY